MSDTFTFIDGTTVNRIGLGGMRLTGQPGNLGPYADWDGGIALLRRAVELGVTFIDTARSYGPLWNERLIADALAPYPADLLIATKGGVDKTPQGGIIRDASPATLIRHIDDALRNLRTDQIGLFQLHRPDPTLPIEESVAALNAAREAGKIRMIGLSNVTVDELQRAMKVAPIASVQNRYNAVERDDDALIDTTARHGIAFLPYGPLGASPMRPGAPLASGAPGDGKTQAQSALRALLDRSPNIVVIPGTTRIAHLEENVDA